LIVIGDPPFSRDDSWNPTSPWCLALVLALCSVAFAQTNTPPVLLVLGDSLSAEYGLPRDSGWVKLLADKVATLGPKGAAQYNVVEASISGETTSGGRTRLPALLTQHHPAVVIIELGGNDGLRGLPLPTMRDIWLRWSTLAAGPERACCWSECAFLPTMVATTPSVFSACLPTSHASARHRSRRSCWMDLRIRPTCSKRQDPSDGESPAKDAR